MKKILLIIVVAVVMVACSKDANDTNIKSTFSTDVYTSTSRVQQFIFGFISSAGTVKYPVDWENKIKLNQNNIILPMHNNSTGKNTTCLVTTPIQGTMLVESCL